jgi:hypothetical protein
MGFMLDNLVLYKPENMLVTVNNIGKRYVQLFSHIPFTDNSQFKSAIRPEIGVIEITDSALISLGYSKTENGFIHKNMQPICNANGTMFHLIHNKTDKGYFFYGVQTISVPFPKYVHELQNMINVLIKYKLTYNFNE